MQVGYARVSTEGQNLDLQIDVLNKAGCEKIFAEKAGGASAARPEYDKMKEFIRDSHDTVVVYKLDRLGRSLKNLIVEMSEFERRKIGFKSLQENIDTTTSGGKLFFHIFAAIAEFERDIIRERTMSGLSAARSRGRLGGRPNKLSASQLQMLRHLYADKNNSIQSLCEMFKIHKSTLFKLVKI